MAGTTYGNKYLPRRLPIWRGGSRAEVLAVSINGKITGTVTENSVAVPYCIVRLYYRPTGILIAQTVTAADGTFTFTSLDTADTGAYMVIAVDPDSGVQYNAIVFDRITAVAV